MENYSRPELFGITKPGWSRCSMHGYTGLRRKKLEKGRPAVEMSDFNRCCSSVRGGSERGFSETDGSLQNCFKIRGRWKMSRKLTLPGKYHNAVA